MRSELVGGCYLCAVCDINMVVEFKKNVQNCNGNAFECQAMLNLYMQYFF